MASYATVEQYEARFGTVTDMAMLQACLDDCTVAINVKLDKAGIDHASPSEDFATRLMMACRSMANRIMPASPADVPVGVSQMSMSAGPYQRSYTFTSAYGTPKMLPSEMELLGIPRARVGCGLMAAPAQGGE